MDKNSISSLRMRMLNAGWSRADITQVGQFYQVSACDPHGREHGGARKNLASLVLYLCQIGAIKPNTVEETVSNELAALLDDGENLRDGKKRLLKEYDTLTQRLHDTKYLMSREEIARSEAISAILLELRK